MAVLAAALAAVPAVTNDARATGDELAWTTISPLPAVKLGEEAHVSLEATGGNPTYTFSVVGGSLPTGLRIDGDGIAGTPTQTGPSTFTLRVTDANGVTADRAFALSVVRGVRGVTLGSPDTQRIVLGTLASRTRAQNTNTASSTVPSPLTSGWVTISGAGPYLITGVDARTGSTYTFQTDFNYAASTSAWRKEGDERGINPSQEHDQHWLAAANVTHSGRSGVLKLDSRAWCPTGANATFSSYCSMFGPEVWSAPFVADAGESLSFDWAAAGGGDDYETYAFLVRVPDSGAPGVDDHTLLAYGRGGTQAWTTASGVVPADGTYRFRFVNGSYDRSGGGLLGAVMYIDPSKVQVGSTQTISFPSLGEQSTASGTPNVLNLNGVVTASSGLPVTLTSTTTGVCTVSGMLVTLVGGGTCTLTVNQGGSDLFVPAATVTGSFTVLLKTAQAAVTASLSATSAVYGDTVTVTPGGGSGTGAYSVSLSANESCSISGSTVTIEAGAGDCAVVVTRAGDAAYAERSSAAQTITVAPRPVSVTGAGAVTRPYDGTTAVAITAGTLSGALAGDSVTLTSPANGTADSAEVGTHDVSATFTLSGARAADYALTQPSLSVTIEQRVLTIGAARTYDGTTEIDLGSDAVSAILANLVTGESLTLSGVGSIASPDASAEARTLTLGTIAIGDAEAGAGTAANYALASSGHTATIDRRPLSSSGSRVYDGSAEIGAGELTLEGFVVGEAVGLTGSATAASADVGRVPADTNVTVVGAAEGLPSFDELRIVVTTQAPGRLWLTSATGLQTITGYPLPTTQAGAQAAIGLRGPRAIVVAALANDLRFRTSSAGVYQVTVEASAGDLTAFASTDGARYYRVISGGFASWSAARDAAENETITLKDGSTASGYLATITSAAENDFIRQYVSSTSWIGASDEFATVNAVLPAGTTPYANQAASEGRWYWVTGPEAGTRFSVGNGSPVAVEDRFNAWASGEPNNSGSEHCGEFYTSGQWNDIPCGASGKPAIVEFGPFPASQDITTTTVVQLGRESQDIFDLTALTLVDGSGGVLASNYTLDGGIHTFTFLPRPVRGSFAAVNRVFDGTLAASVLDGSRALAAAAGSPEGTGVVAPDVGLVTLTGGTATFDAASIGPRTATLSGATLGGARAANYALDGVDPAAAAITARLLTIASAGTFEVYGGAGRIYDGSRTATITSWGLTLEGIAVGDTVVLEPVAEFVTAGAGLDKEVRISASSVLSGPDAANYTLDVTGAPTASASITPRPVTVTGASAAPRPYDGTTTVSIAGASLANVVAGDAVTLANAISGVAASRDAGTQAVSTSMTIAGAAAANYRLVGQPSLTVTITPLPVAVTMNALPARAYDGTSAIPLTPAAFSVSGVLPSESIGVSGTAQLSSRSPGTRTVTLATPTFTPGAGTDLANYTLPSSVTGSVTITPLPLRIAGATVTQRTWDGTTTATIAGARLDGLRAGDNVSLTGATAGVFASSQPGTHPVRFTPTLAGVDAINYTLVVPELTGTIARAPASLRITGGLTQFADGSPRTVRAAVSPASAGRVVVTYPGGSAPSAPGSYPVSVTLDSTTHTAEPLSVTLTISPLDALVLPTSTSPTPTTPGTSPTPATPVDDARRAEVLARIAVRTDGTLALPEIGPVLEPDGTAPAFTPREHRVLEDGEPTTARIVVVEDQRVRVETDDDSFSIELQAAVATDDGRIPLPLDADGTLLLDRGGLVEVGGSGFLPGSTAEVWMFSEATFLGTAIVGPDGTFSGAFPVDELLAPGEHTIQLNGTGADQQVRSTSLGVRIDDPEAPTRDRVVITAASDTTSSNGPLWLLALAALLGATIMRWWIVGRRRRDDDEDDEGRIR